MKTTRYVLWGKTLSSEVSIKLEIGSYNQCEQASRRRAKESVGNMAVWRNLEICPFGESPPTQHPDYALKPGR